MHTVTDLGVVELRTQLVLIIGWLRYITRQLLLRVSEAALVSEATRAPLLHVPTHLRLSLGLLLFIQLGWNKLLNGARLG